MRPDLEVMVKTSVEMAEFFGNVRRLINVAHDCLSVFDQEDVPFHYECVRKELAAALLAIDPPEPLKKPGEVAS